MGQGLRRGQESAHWVCGLHAVRHILSDMPESALELWVQVGAENAGDLLPLAARGGVAVQTVPRQTLDDLTAGSAHQGVVLRCRPPVMLNDDDLPRLLGQRAGVPLLLVLEGIQDPHNLGACLRTAEAAAVDAVITPQHRGCPITATVSKVACGAAQRVPFVQARNLARVLRGLKDAGLWLVGTGDSATASLYEVDLRQPTALILGSEDRGLRQLTQTLCDQVVRLPMLGAVESLNVSVATGICLYEALRQRRLDIPCSQPGGN